MRVIRGILLANVAGEVRRVAFYFHSWIKPREKDGRVGLTSGHWRKESLMGLGRKGGWEERGEGGGREGRDETIISRVPVMRVMSHAGPGYHVHVQKAHVA